MGVQSLDQEDLLEKEMATHSSSLAWRIPWTEVPGGLQSTVVPKSRTRLSETEQQQLHIDPGSRNLTGLSVLTIDGVSQFFIL